MAAEDGSWDSTTSVNLGRAGRGEAESLAWLIERFGPLLLAQARYRLRGQAHVYQPEDLVNDVWAIVLRRLPDLELPAAAAFVGFLGTTLLNRYRNVLRTHIRRRRGGEDAGVELTELSAETSGIVTRATRAENHAAALEALDALDDADREVILLRGVEQAPRADVAALLGVEPNAVSQRYRRALARLRARAAGSVFDCLPAE